MSSVVSVGDVIAEKYEVERVLGEGGMGVVVAARHRDLGHRVAIKFLHPEALAIPEIAARFSREARTLAKLKSEHAARVIDVGLGGERPHIVLELLEGRDLGQLVDEQGPLPIEEAVSYVLQAAHAIAEAHALGVVHRDLKPANLFLADRPDGRRVIKVLDFGIARHREAGDTKLTQTGATMGSPSYMAPEQMRSAGDADERTDVWGFGAVLYELLIGSPPFTAPSMTEVVAKVLADATPSLKLQRPDIPAPLEDAVFQCLAKEPRRRFESVAALALALAPYASPRARDLVEAIEALGKRDDAGATAPATVVSRGVADAPTVVSHDPPGAVAPTRGSSAVEPGPTRVVAPATSAVTPGAGAQATRPSAPSKVESVTPRNETGAPALTPARSRTWIVAPIVAGLAGLGWLALGRSTPGPDASPKASNSASSEAPRSASAPARVDVVVSTSSASAAVPEPVASGAAPSASISSSAIARPSNAPPPVRTSSSVSRPTASPTSTGSLSMPLK